MSTLQIKSSNLQSGFTLVKLLVAIATLRSLLSPSLRKAKQEYWISTYMGYSMPTTGGANVVKTFLCPENVIRGMLAYLTISNLVIYALQNASASSGLLGCNHRVPWFINSNNCL
jgi:hypothetical protein